MYVQAEIPQAYRTLFVAVGAGANAPNVFELEMLRVNRRTLEECGGGGAIAAFRYAEMGGYHQRAGRISGDHNGCGRYCAGRGGLCPSAAATELKGREILLLSWSAVLCREKLTTAAKCDAAQRVLEVATGTQQCVMKVNCRRQGRRDEELSAGGSPAGTYRGAFLKRAGWTRWKLFV